LITKYPDDIDILGELIDAYLITENFDKALDKIEMLETLVGPTEAIIEQRLNIYRQQGQTKKLVAELEKLITENPENLRYYNLLAQVYQTTGDNKNALKIYEKIKKIDPNDPYVNVSLLEFYTRIGEKEKAFQELLAAIRNKNLDFATKTNIYDFWMQNNEDSDLLHEQARQCGEAFIETHPDDKLGYIILGSYHIIKGNDAQSKTLYLKSLSIDSTDFYSWQNLIISESRLGENEAVREHSIKALKHYPMHSVFYWYAGVSCAVMDMTDEAITYLEKGRRFVSEKSQIASFDGFLGDLYHQQGNEEKAFEAYDRTLLNNPDDALVLNNYAYFLAVKNQELDKALEMSTKAISLEPDNPTYLDTHAWVLYMRGDYKAAEKFMSKALKLLEEPDETYTKHYEAIISKLKK